METFSSTLARLGFVVRRGVTHTLQVNVGLACNQACRHCHLGCGPGRPEVMSRETMESVLSYARQARFSVIDITGGAPELNPDLRYLLQGASACAPRVMLRSNLTLLENQESANLLYLCKEHHVVIIASLPSVNVSQAESQRGKGTWEKIEGSLRKLNELGYGREGTGLELNLVCNPAGAFLPPPQQQAEKNFRKRLLQKYDIVFNNLYTFANVPLGRFLQWLKDSGNYSDYTKNLKQNFNPCTVEGLMCRTLVSVSWDGFLFDCDFNLAAGLPIGGSARHISELDVLPEPGADIATGIHCFACTAGSGFT